MTRCRHYTAAKGPLFVDHFEGLSFLEATRHSSAYRNFWQEEWKVMWLRCRRPKELIMYMHRLAETKFYTDNAPQTLSYHPIKGSSLYSTGVDKTPTKFVGMNDFITFAKGFQVAQLDGEIPQNVTGLKNVMKIFLENASPLSHVPSFPSYPGLKDPLLGFDNPLRLAKTVETNMKWPTVEVGPVGVVSSLHTKIHDLPNIDVCHVGCKAWIIIHPSSAKELVSRISNCFPGSTPGACYLRQKKVVVPLGTLEEWGIQHTIIFQEEGDVVITFPGVITETLNLSFCVNTAMNFLTLTQEDAIHISQTFQKCRCSDPTDPSLESIHGPWIPEIPVKLHSIIWDWMADFVRNSKESTRKSGPSCSTYSSLPPLQLSSLGMGSSDSSCSGDEVLAQSPQILAPTPPPPSVHSPRGGVEAPNNSSADQSDTIFASLIAAGITNLTADSPEEEEGPNIFLPSYSEALSNRCFPNNSLPPLHSLEGELTRNVLGSEYDSNSLIFGKLGNPPPLGEGFEGGQGPTYNLDGEHDPAIVRITLSSASTVEAESSPLPSLSWKHLYGNSGGSDWDMITNREDFYPAEESFTETCSSYLESPPGSRHHLSVPSSQESVSVEDATAEIQLLPVGFPTIQETTLAAILREERHSPELIPEKMNTVPIHKRKLGPNKKREFKCPQCSQRLSSKPHLQRHIYLKHSPEEIKVKCPICLKVFANNVSLAKHRRIINKSVSRKSNLCRGRNERLTEDKRVRCEICQELFAQKGGYNRHMKTKHGLCPKSS